MIARTLMAALTVAFLGYASSRAQEALVTYKTLSPELALDLASAALTDCRQRGFQVAVAVVAPLKRAVQPIGSVVAIPVLGGLHHQYVRI